jgi:hypothetical protein
VEALASKDNVVFDPALEGAWNSGDAVVMVQRGDDLGYRIHWIGTETTSTPRVLEMEGKLVKVGDQRILDLVSSDPGAFSIPCHVFLRIRPVKEGLKVQFVDSKWIRDQAKAAALPSFVFEDTPVLTASTARLGAFFLKFGFDEQALDNPMILRALKQP